MKPMADFIREGESEGQTLCPPHLTMVTPFGILRNSHSGRVQSEVTLVDLFKEG